MTQITSEVSKKHCPPAQNGHQLLANLVATLRQETNLSPLTRLQAPCHKGITQYTHLHLSSNYSHVVSNSILFWQICYMFRTSHTKAQTAVDIDEKDPENPLQSEEVYFNESHLQCIGYKTLALLVYHPAM